MVATNTYFDIASLRASDVANATAFLAQVASVPDGLFYWTLGDFTGQVDDKNVVKADSVAVNAGAWVRQGTASITTRQIGANAVLRSAQDKIHETVSVTDYGALGNDAVDDTAAFQQAINAARALGASLYVPFGTYRISSALTIPFDEAKRGIRIHGEASGNYYGDDRQSTIRYTGSTGHLFSIVGENSLAHPDGTPAMALFDGLRFLGNNMAAGAVLIERAWYVEFERCAFAQWDHADAAAVTFKATGASGFAGDSSLRDCVFGNCTRNLLLTGGGVTGGQVNSVHLFNCKGVDQKHAIEVDFGSLIPFTSDIIAIACSWQGCSHEAIKSQGVANAWLIDGGYVEDHNALPAFKFSGASNLGITIRNVLSRKTALGAGNALVYAENVKGLTVIGNSSGFGGASDRYSVDVVNGSNLDVEVLPVTGASPYPLRVNNYVIASGRVSELWAADMPSGGLFNGVSSGDGWPGGTAANLVAKLSKSNGKVRINFKQTITTKSPAGTLTLIGLIPYPNDGADVPFRVSITDVTTDKPKFYDAILPSGTPFATVYDSNGDVLDYQTAFKVGTIVRAEFEYVTTG